MTAIIAGEANIILHYCVGCYGDEYTYLKRITSIIVMTSSYIYMNIAAISEIQDGRHYV